MYGARGVWRAIGPDPSRQTVGSYGQRRGRCGFHVNCVYDILVANVPPALRWGNVTSYCRLAELEVFSLIGRTTYDEFLRRFHTV